MTKLGPPRATTGVIKRTLIGSPYTSAGRSIFVFFQWKFGNCLAVLIHDGHAPV